MKLNKSHNVFLILMLRTVVRIVLGDQQAQAGITDWSLFPTTNVIVANTAMRMTNTHPFFFFF